MYDFEATRWFLAFGAAMGCGLMAGVFFTFSNFVMRGLRRIEPAAGIAAMQSINRTVINPWFMLGFLGTTGVCVTVAAMAIIRWDNSSVFLLIGCVLYVVGNFVVTMVGNVPLNNALERVQADSAEGHVLWQRYLVVWTRWNHVRAVTALAGMGALIVGLTVDL